MLAPHLLKYHRKFIEISPVINLLYFIRITKVLLLLLLLLLLISLFYSSSFFHVTRELKENLLLLTFLLLTKKIFCLNILEKF